MSLSEQTSRRNASSTFMPRCAVSVLSNVWVIRGTEEDLVKGAAHLSIGQEAVAAGICGNLRWSDQIEEVTTVATGHTIASGADPEAMMRELFGKEGGICGGKGGSMHIADFNVGILGANGIVGAETLIAVGAAKSKKMLGTNDIVVCFFGDGAVNRGPFLEGLNWARVFDLPVLFVCEDNKYAATTRTDQLTVVTNWSLAPRVSAFRRKRSMGMTQFGWMFWPVIGATDKQSGSGPQLLHVETYRHIGHTQADPATYRPTPKSWKRSAIRSNGPRRFWFRMARLWPTSIRLPPMPKRKWSRPGRPRAGCALAGFFGGGVGRPRRGSAVMSQMTYADVVAASPS